jgi:threonine aldolase
MDGARLANAAAHLDCGLAEFTTEAGVDLISLGGTKNGLLFGEAILVPRPHEQRIAVAALPYLRKLDLQLASKMRFVSAQLVALLGDDLWLRSARRANAMAARLAAGLSTVDGVRVTQPVQSNAVFAILDPAVAGRLRESFRFHDWDPARGEVRWMCAFDTTDEDVDAFLAELRRLL